MTDPVEPPGVGETPTGTPAEQDTAGVPSVPAPVVEELLVGYAWIYHPKLDRRIQVPESAVQIHRGSGWVLPEEVEAAPTTIEEKKPAARRRRDSEKENT